jgi:K+/H+ antiporter YhaU regulatory subunit KhtT
MTNSKFLPVIDNKDLVRDTRSKALLATNKAKLEEHRQKKQLLSKMVNQTQEIENMKNDIKEIKDLLHTLIKNK